MDKSVLKQFLKAGFVFKQELFAIEDGTPQGGVISPILANIALDGIQELLIKHFELNKKGKHCYYMHQRTQVNFVRYADDFIVTAKTIEIAEEVKVVIQDFLKTRGLELSEEKTVISHIDEGFDMLGWTFRKFKGKLIVKPSKKSIKSFVTTLSDTILGRGKAWKQESLIEKLNQQIRGWTNYHQSVCANATFSYIDNSLFWLLWRWARRRHPHKGKGWIVKRYWHRKGNRNWVFCIDTNELLRLDYTPIIRHSKVRMNANPYFDTEYFTELKFNRGVKRLSGKFKTVWKNQKGLCHHCGLPMEVSEDKEIFFKTPKFIGGKDDVTNMAYVHEYCNRLYFERCRS